MHNLGKVFGPHMDILEKIITTHVRSNTTDRWGCVAALRSQRGQPTKNFEACRIRILKCNYITKGMLTLGIKTTFWYIQCGSNFITD